MTAVLFFFVIMILDVKIRNKPTILQKIISIDFIGDCTVLIAIFRLFSPNFLCLIYF